MKFITNPTLRASSLDGLFGYLALYVYVLLLPFFLIDHVGLTAARAGLVMTAEPALSVFTGPIGGRLSDRFGSRALVLIGLAITSAGLWALSGLSLASTAWDATWRVAVIGLGFGLFYTPNNSALIGAAPAGWPGVATGVASVASNLGMAAGIALGSAMVTFASGNPVQSNDSFLTGYVMAMRLAALICIAAMVIGARWMQPRPADPPSP